MLRADHHRAVGNAVHVLQAVGQPRVDDDDHGGVLVDAGVRADQLLADIAGLHALAEGVADVVGDADGGLRVAEADTLLLQGGQELVVGGAGVGCAGGEQGGQGEPAARAVPVTGLVNREVNIAVGSFYGGLALQARSECVQRLGRFSTDSWVIPGNPAPASPSPSRTLAPPPMLISRSVTGRLRRTPLQWPISARSVGSRSASGITYAALVLKGSMFDHPCLAT